MPRVLTGINPRPLRAVRHGGRRLTPREPRPIAARDFASQVLDFRAGFRTELGVTLPIVDFGGSLPTSGSSPDLRSPAMRSCCSRAFFRCATRKTA